MTEKETKEKTVDEKVREAIETIQRHNDEVSAWQKTITRVREQISTLKAEEAKLMAKYDERDAEIRKTTDARRKVVWDKFKDILRRGCEIEEDVSVSTCHNNYCLRLRLLGPWYRYELSYRLDGRPIGDTVSIDLQAAYIIVNGRTTLVPMGSDYGSEWEGYHYIFSKSAGRLDNVLLAIGEIAKTRILRNYVSGAAYEFIIPSDTLRERLRELLQDTTTMASTESHEEVFDRFI